MNSARLLPDDHALSLVVESLSVARGGRLVLTDVSFMVAPGEALMLTGANGAGKTTLLRTVAGFLAPEAGRVRLTPPTGVEDDDVAGRCHFVGHLDGVKGALTVAENLAFAADWLGGDRNGTWRAIEDVGLAGLEPVAARFLSAGQRRRVALARLLVAPRPVWLLDEPTASLDAAGQALLARMAETHMTRGGLVVAATHLPLGITGARETRLGGGTIAEAA